MVKRPQWVSKNKKLVKKLKLKFPIPFSLNLPIRDQALVLQKLKTPDQLEAAMDEAFKYDTKVLIEKALNVYELDWQY